MDRSRPLRPSGHDANMYDDLPYSSDGDRGSAQGYQSFRKGNRLFGNGRTLNMCWYWILKIRKDHLLEDLQRIYGKTGTTTTMNTNMNDQDLHDGTAEEDTQIEIKRDTNLHEIEAEVGRLILAPPQIEPSFWKGSH